MQHKPSIPLSRDSCLIVFVLLNPHDTPPALSFVKLIRFLTVFLDKGYGREFAIASFLTRGYFCSDALATQVFSRLGKDWVLLFYAQLTLGK
jgi:hypothetical protein